MFNVYAHNRDDHSRNFAFLMDPDGCWQLAPAYDITYNDGPGGEHQTDVMGEGKAPLIGRQLGDKVIAVARSRASHEERLPQSSTI